MNPTNGGPDSKGPCFRKAADTQQVLTMCGALRLPLSTRRPANPHFPGLGSAGGRPGPARACPTPSGLSFPSAPPTHSIPRGRGDPGPTPTSSYGARSPGSPKSPEPRTSGPPSSAPSTPHSPLRQPNPDPPTAAPAYRGPARSRPPQLRRLRRRSQHPRAFMLRRRTNYLGGRGGGSDAI